MAEITEIFMGDRFLPACSFQGAWSSVQTGHQHTPGTSLEDQDFRKESETRGALMWLKLFSSVGN